MNRDFRDLLCAFNVHQVEYLVVGAHAMAAHGYIRATKDLDIWVRATAANSRRVYPALAEFGAPIGELTPDDFSRLGLIYQIGVPPVRIDVITQIDGLTFDEAWPDRFASHFDGEPASVLSVEHLIRNKKSSLSMIAKRAMPVAFGSGSYRPRRESRGSNLVFSQTPFSFSTKWRIMARQASLISSGVSHGMEPG